jgi:phosphatidylserine decarboxylase
MNIAESIKSVISPPHKAGYPFILGGIAVAVLGCCSGTRSRAHC